MNDKNKELFKYVFILLYSRPRYFQKDRDYIKAREFIQSLDVNKELSEEELKKLNNLNYQYDSLTEETSIGIVMANEIYKKHIEKKND